MTQTVRTLLLVSGIATLLAHAAVSWAAPDDLEGAPAPAQPQQPQMVFNQANFDQWVFQNRQNATKARSQIEDRLKLQLTSAARRFGLSDSQQRKLQLAADGDIARFFDEIEIVRGKFGELANDPNALGPFWQQEIQPLQTKMTSGLFGAESLYSKVLKAILDSEQGADYQATLEERRRFRYRAAIEAAISMLEDGVPLEQRQRDALIKLLVERTQPPATFGQFDYYLVVYRLSTLPEKDLQALLDERQWELLQPQLQQGQAMKQMLVQGQVIDAE